MADHDTHDHTGVPGVGVTGYTAPTFVAAGVSASGVGAVVPGLPAGHAADDINVLLVQSANQAVTAPAGWTQLGPQVGYGTTRLAIFWKRDSGADGDPTVADTGDHTLAQIIGIRGAVPTGDPFLSIGQTRKATASTTGTAAAGATPVDNCLVVNAFAHNLDSAAAVFSAWANASLASITERVDVATADGSGGGIGVATGVLEAAGSFVATTVTETSTIDVSSTFIVLPAEITHRAGFIDIQVFSTAGFADTWTKPTGAKRIDVIAIGGGGGGSAGRNAATAAGGGGGGGGGWTYNVWPAGSLPATLTVTPGAGGAATAHADGTAGNSGVNSLVSNGVAAVQFGIGAGASASGSGGVGGSGGGVYAVPPSAGQEAYGGLGGGGGTGGTTAMAGGRGIDFGGGGGAGGGTTQAGSAGGNTRRGGGGGGGGRANGFFGVGGSGGGSTTGGASAGAAGEDNLHFGMGGAGGAGGTSTSGTGGRGGFPGGGGGGGGSQAAAQGGGAGGDGQVVITTFC